MKKLLFSMAVVAMIASSAVADPSYWNFNGPVTQTVGLPAGTFSTNDFDPPDVMYGRFWGDPVTNELWELRWWTDLNGDSFASPTYLQTDFSGYNIYYVDPDFIEATRFHPLLDSISFSPTTAVSSFRHTIGTSPTTDGFARVILPIGERLEYNITAAPSPTPVPVPGAVLLGMLGLGWVRMKQRWFV